MSIRDEGENEDIPDGNIRSFADKGTQDIFRGRNTKDARNNIPVHLHDKARSVMNDLDAAARLYNLRHHDITRIQGTPEGEKWYELDINRQYRVYFLWDNGKARRVLASDHL